MQNVKIRGNTTNIHLSKIWAFSSSVLTGLDLLFTLVSLFSLLTFIWFLNFLPTRIHEYSNIAMKILARHIIFHCTKAVGLPPDCGEFFTTEFRIFIWQSERVRRSPRRAGMVSCGTRKLTWNDRVVIWIYPNEKFIENVHFVPTKWIPGVVVVKYVLWNF